MITTPTCLVLGAGASHPYGLPTGAELRHKILGSLGGRSMEVHTHLARSGWSTGQLKGFVSEFRRSSISVDAFLAQREDLRNLGKHAISAVLISCEQGQKLKPEESEEDWYSLLWDKLQYGAKGRFSSNRLSVVTFNYDRSLEEFLIQAHSATFRVNRKEAADALFETIKVVHVHGQLGNLPENGPQSTARLYEPVLSETRIRTAASGLIILPEAQEDSKEFENARELINGSRKTLFLGLAYHPENMTRLGFRMQHDPESPVTLRGSAYGLTTRECSDVQKRWGIETGDPSWGTRRFLREKVDLI